MFFNGKIQNFKFFNGKIQILNDRYLKSQNTSINIQNIKLHTSLSNNNSTQAYINPQMMSKKSSSIPISLVPNPHPQTL